MSKQIAKPNLSDILNELKLDNKYNFNKLQELTQQGYNAK